MNHDYTLASKCILVNFHPFFLIPPPLNIPLPCNKHPARKVCRLDRVDPRERRKLGGKDVKIPLSESMDAPRKSIESFAREPLSWLRPDPLLSRSLEERASPLLDFYK